MLAGLLSGLVFALIIHTLTRNEGSFLADIMNRYESGSYDSRLRSRAFFSEEGSIDDVIVIDIDLNSIETLGNYYDWPHAYHGQLIDVVTSGSPSALIFDIIFDPRSSYDYELLSALASSALSLEPDLEKAADQYLTTNDPSRLIYSTANSSVVHHALVLDQSDSVNFLYAMESIPEEYNAQRHVLDIPEDIARSLPQAERIGNLFYRLLNSSQHVGTSNFPPDPDGVIRRAPSAIRFQGSGEVFPSITLSAVMDILDIPSDGVIYDMDNNIMKLRDRSGTIVRNIPIDDQGRIYVNYFGKFKTFTYIPYVYSMDPEMLDPSYWKGKVAIVGSSLAGLGDIKSTSVQESFAGPEIHANVIHSILQNDFVSPVSKAYSLWSMVIVSCLLGAICGIPSKPFWGFGLLIIASALWVIYATDQFLSKGVMWDVVRPITSLTLTQLSVFSFTFLIMDRDKRFLRQTFGTYISPALISQMIEDKEEPKLGGAEEIQTAFFTDVQKFSTFSEQLSATELVDLLNTYLTDMTTILLDNKGTLDKYIGDAIVAFFGAPVPIEDHQLCACKAALEMQEGLHRLRKQWLSEGDRWPNIVHSMQNRIGIHTGPMVTGNMGSQQRMNYTMMGDTVNIASRLESSCKQYGIYTHISEDTFSAVKDDVTVRELDRIVVVGRKEPITTYELISLKGEESDNMRQLVSGFAEALDQFRKMKWNSAKKLFESLEAYEEMYEGRTTNPCQVYIRRCENYKKDPPPDNWDGVTVLTIK
ncbi:MAG: hypothetical protein CMI31_14690 [Opitutae bacterium]|nr:hypothetical protein [Opitutae bacterium]